MFASLGKDQTEEMVNEMLNEASGPINFTMFLTLFGVKLNGTDSEEVVINAFSMFDEDNTGLIPEDQLRDMMTTIGDIFTSDEVSDKMLISIHTKRAVIFSYFTDLIV